MALPKEKRLYIERNADQIIAMYHVGLSQVAIGRAFGVSAQPIKTLLRKLGVKKRTRAESQAVRNRHSASHSLAFRERAISLYFESGWSLPRIAKDVGLHKDHLARCFREWGVKLRTERQRRSVWSLWRCQTTRERCYNFLLGLSPAEFNVEAERLGVSPVFLARVLDVTFICERDCRGWVVSCSRLFNFFSNL